MFDFEIVKPILSAISMLSLLYVVHFYIGTSNILLDFLMGLIGFSYYFIVLRVFGELRNSDVELIKYVTTPSEFRKYIAIEIKSNAK